MKHLIVPALLAAALTAAPALSKADETTAPPTPSPAMLQIMEQTHARMDQLHSQARLAMLNSLTPAQRNLLAQTVGQLAIAANPDPAAAARTLDASLTQTEGRAIINISASLEQQTRQLMETAHQQMMSAMPAGAPAHGFWGNHVYRVQKVPGSEPWRTDPGTILLGMAAHSAETGGFHGMPMPMPPPAF